MSKAIIEIEKPKRCKDCFWYQADPWFGGSCKLAKEEDGWNKHIGADEEYDVQKWCPLLPKTEAIPIEWIHNKYREKWEKDEMRKGDFQFCEVIHDLLEMWDLEKEDWKKENGVK